MGGPPATLISAIWPSGTNDGRPGPRAAGACGAPGIADGMSSPPIDGPADIGPIEGIGMSDADGGPLGRRGRAMSAPDPEDAPPAIPVMFCARKIGCGQPTASADA